jgi:hypothetical protein
MLVKARLMQRSQLAVLVRMSTAAGVAALSCLLVQAQALPADATPPAAAPQSGSAASLGDTLLAKATNLYDSTAKSGLHGFDCQAHPDWNKIESSAKKGAPDAADDAKVALLNTVKITLHARLGGASSIDWQLPQAAEKQLDPATSDMLDHSRHGVENTLVGFLKLWTPLIDGSVAESLGEADLNVTPTGAGYTLRSKDKGRPLTEEFDRDLLLRHFILVDSGSTVDISPAFRPSAHGLLVESFAVRIHPPGAPPEAAHEMHIGLEYQTVSTIQIPARISVEVPNVVEMDFALDGCSVNPASN